MELVTILVCGVWIVASTAAGSDVQQAHATEQIGIGEPEKHQQNVVVLEDQAGNQLNEPQVERPPQDKVGDDAMGEMTNRKVHSKKSCHTDECPSGKVCQRRCRSKCVPTETREETDKCGQPTDKDQTKCCLTTPSGYVPLEAGQNCANVAGGNRIGDCTCGQGTTTPRSCDCRSNGAACYMMPAICGGKK